MERAHIIAVRADKLFVFNFGTLHHTHFFAAKGTRFFAENVFKEIAKSPNFSSF